MRTRQVVIPFIELAGFGSGAMLKVWLRGQGINPDGRVVGFRDEERQMMVYTEILGEGDERPEAIGEVSALAGGVRHAGGEVGAGRPAEDVRAGRTDGDVGGEGRDDRPLLHVVEGGPENRFSRYRKLFARAAGIAGGGGG